MASAIASRQCAKCKDNIGSFNCEGCKEIFCLKHCIEHRQELGNKFEQLMTEHNDIIQQIQEKEPQNESSKTNVLDRIDQWESTIINKVHERAEQIRQQFAELMRNENKVVMDNMQALTDEIRRRNEKQDFLEHDIERIRESISQIQIAINKSIQLSDIDLYVEPENTIAWESLIYIKEKLPKTSSSVINKQSTDQNTKGVENTINSNLPSSFMSISAAHYLPSPPLWYMPDFRPPTNGNNTNITYSQYITGMPVPYSSSSSREKREKKPLKIVDPGSNESPELMTSNVSTDPNSDLLQSNLTNAAASSSSSNPSSATNSTQRKTKFQQQSTDLLSDNSKK